MNKFSILRPIIRFTNKIRIPGFEGLSLYQVSRFFFSALYKGAITTRAGAMAFSFFLALFPAIIFIFSIIPFLPIENIDQLILEQLKILLPKEAYTLSYNTIQDLAKNQSGSLLSFGFLLMIVFASNGINNMIETFNLSIHTEEKRSFVNQWGVSFILIFILFLLLVFSSVLIIFGETILDFIESKELISNTLLLPIFDASRWLVILLFFYFAISFMFYLAPASRSKWKFFSAGSSLASLMIILFSVGFAYYVNHFGQYNKLYGSIGTLMVIMLWIYFNSLVLLIGFELNASIARAKTKRGKKLLLT